MSRVAFLELSSFTAYSLVSKFITRTGRYMPVHGTVEYDVKLVQGSYEYEDPKLPSNVYNYKLKRITVEGQLDTFCNIKCPY